MVARGVHLALTAEVEQRLRDCPANDRPVLVADDIERPYFDHARKWLCQTDKAWDGIHRAFAGDLDYEYRSPLHGVVLGGEQLYFKSDFIISLKTVDQVRAIAEALDTVSEASFRPLYFAIDARKAGFDIDDDDFRYTWSWLRGLVPFYLRSAEAGRSVVFFTDQ